MSLPWLSAATRRGRLGRGGGRPGAGRWVVGGQGVAGAAGPERGKTVRDPLVVDEAADRAADGRLGGGGRGDVGGRTVGGTGGLRGGRESQPDDRREEDGGDRGEEAKGGAGERHEHCH